MVQYQVQIRPWDSEKGELTQQQVRKIPRRYFQSALYAFTIEAFKIVEDAGKFRVQITFVPNLQRFRELVLDPKNVGAIVQDLIHEFKEGKYDSWMEGETYFSAVSPNEIELELDWIKVLLV